MRRTRSIPTRLLALALAAGANPPASAATSGVLVDRKPIRLATLAPQGSSSHQILLAMGEKWREGPDGGVRLIVNAGGLMGGEADVVAKMRAGQIHAALLTAVGLGEIDKAALALQGGPMFYRSLDEFVFVREKLRPSLEKAFLAKGFVALFWCDVGWVRYFSRRPIVHPSDLKAVKIFTWAGSTEQIDLMKSIGLDPVPLEPNDILPSLRTGLIDAVTTAPYYAQVLQYYDPAPHMLDLAWAPLFGGLVITRKVWDGIPAELQKGMSDAASKAGEELTVRNRKESDESVEAMKKRGLIVHEVTPAIEAEWRAFVEPIYPKLRGVDVPAELFDEVQASVAEYRKTVSAGAKANEARKVEPKKVEKVAPR